MTQEVKTDKNFLNLPIAERQKFKNNFLDSVTAEFRFPVLLEISETSPVDIQKSIRDSFPIYQLVDNAELVPAGGVRTKTQHEFIGKNKSEKVTLSEGSLAYSTNSYVCYEDFRGRCEYILKEVLPFLETDFFTRIGLRYINRIEAPNIRQEVESWISKELVSFISSGALGSVDSLKMEILGKIDNESNYIFRYGLFGKSLNYNNSSSENTVDFVLDFDYWSEDIKVNDALKNLDLYHDKNYDFFWWALGEKAKEKLNA